MYKEDLERHIAAIPILSLYHKAWELRKAHAGGQRASEYEMYSNNTGGAVAIGIGMRKMGDRLARIAEEMAAFSPEEHAKLRKYDRLNAQATSYTAMCNAIRAIWPEHFNGN